MIGHMKSGTLVTTQCLRYTFLVLGIGSLLVVQTLTLSLSVNSNLILDTHNMYRRIFANGAYNVFVADMNKLIWNNELYEKSKRNLRCEDVNGLSRSHEMNLNIGISLNRNVTNIIRTWFSEVKYFLPNHKMCFNMDDCRRFLTMINSKQRQIGCSMTTCIVGSTRQHVMLCYYSGGIDIWNPYQTGLPCTKCQNNAGFCTTGLCDNCNFNAESCDCKKTCSKPGVGHGLLNISTCTCECEYGMGPNCDEPCRNPEQYLDYDICEAVSASECLSEDQNVRDMLAEFCPETCSCNKAPASIDLV